MAAIDYSKYGYKSESDEEVPTSGGIDYSKYGAQPKQSQTNQVESKPINIFAPDNRNTTTNQFRPKAEELKKTAIATGRGFTDIGEGLKQLYLEKLGKAGETEKYTQGTEAERKLYNESEVGRDPEYKGMRELVNASPYMLPIGRLARTASLLPKMIEGAASMGAIGASKYVAPDESRFMNTVEDAALGAIFPAIPTIAKTGASIIKAVPQQFRRANPIVNAQKIATEAILPEQKEALGIAQEKLATQEQSEAEAKGIANQEINKVDPDKIQYAIGKKGEALDKTENKLNDLQQKLEEHKNLPEFPEIGKDHIENLANAEKSVAESGEHAAGAEQAHGEAKELLGNSEQQLGHHLNEGATHNLHASRALRHEIRSVNRYWSSSYNNLMHDLGTSNFQIDAPHRMQELNEVINTARQRYSGENAGQFGEHGDFANTIRLAPNSNDTSASDFLKKFKDFRNARFKLRDNLIKEPSNVKKDEMVAAYRDTQPIADLLEQTLEEGLGQHSDEFRRINEGYRNQVFPLRENKVAKKLLEKEKRVNGQPVLYGKSLSNSNMISQLSGDEVGQDVLRELARRNPEVRRNIIGQRFSKPSTREEVYNPNEAMREYLHESPDTQRLIDARQRARSLTEQHAENVSQAKERQKQIQEEHKEAVSEHKVKEKAISDQQKEKVDREKKGADLQTKADEAKKQVEGIKKSIVDHEKHMKFLRKEADKTDITLKEKVKREKEYKESKTKLRELNTQLHSSQGNVIRAMISLKNFGKGLYKWVEAIGSGKLF